MDDVISCVECGRTFDISDSDYISESANAVSCPYCGRANYCEIQEVQGLRVESLYDQPETDEPYTEDYFSKDLLYDGGYRKESPYKHIGVAKRKSDAQLIEDMTSGYITAYFNSGKQSAINKFLDNDMLPERPRKNRRKPMLEERPERVKDE